jgi:hypothetical protein
VPVPSSAGQKQYPRALLHALPPLRIECRLDHAIAPGVTTLCAEATAAALRPGRSVGCNFVSLTSGRGWGRGNGSGRNDYNARDAPQPSPLGLWTIRSTALHVKRQVGAARTKALPLPDDPGNRRPPASALRSVLRARDENYLPMSSSISLNACPGPESG